MTDKPIHTLIVTQDTDGTHYFDIECPQVTDHCRTWEEANCPQAKHSDLWDGDTWFDYTGETEAHGAVHAYVDGAWHHPSDRCWLSESRDDLLVASEELKLAPGRYPVTFDYVCGGEGAFTLELVEPAVTR